MNRTKVEEKKCELGKIDVTSPTEVVDYAAGLHREITEETNKIAFLCKTVEQKDDQIKLLLKEKSILEGEKSLLQKEQQSAIKDKESIVMRFAIVEKNLLDVKTQLEQADKREKRIQKELDTLNEKIKIAKDEKGRIASALDSKSQEHRNCLKDIEKLRTEISSLETRCKWSTVKLRQEIEAKHVLEKELHDLKNTEICTKSDNGESTLEKISELKANQITLKHVNVEQADKISALEQQLENTFKERTTLQSLLEITNDKRTKLSVDFEKLQQENLDLQHQLDTNVLKIAELQAKLNDLGTVRAQLSIVNEINNNLTEHMKNIERQLADQTADVSKFNQRESELLALNEELSSLNATLQNEISLQKSKSIAMSIENNSSKENQSHYEVNIVKLQEQLEYEKKCRYEERLVMAKHLAEKTKDCEVLQQKLDQISGDLDAVKKKNLFIVKDLQREIATLQKSSSKPVDALSIGNSVADDQFKPNSSGSIKSVDEFEEKEPSKTKLIERIIRLQHASNRQAEKIDFLENHSSTLVAELQKKTKIVQHYMMKEQATSTSSGDKNKMYNGIMHAIYGNAKPSDMSLELVLEVNKKLQSVLEDTLLKNITLKDNLDTLGLEVDRLTRQVANYKSYKR